MASFTDQIQTFNPYVETLPTEAMYTVGTVMQSRFDQGLKQAQGYIDSIAGFPVARDVDRQYVQSALDSLKKGVDASLINDFGNFQTINQIGSAASKIASDPTIQRAISSAMRVKKGFTELEDAKKTGKGYSNQNEWWFNTQVESWMNSGDLNQQFTGGYTPYTDVVGEIMKLYKDLPDSENVTRDGFRMESGKLIYNPTLLKGKSAQRVQDVIDLVYSKPEVQQQLSIDGEFKYRGQSPDALYQSLTTSTQSQIDTINDSISKLQIRSSTDKTLDPQAIDSELNTLKLHAAQLRDAYTRNVNLLATNPSALKAAITAQEISSNFIGAYTSEIAVDNPLWDAYMKEQDFDLDKKKFIWQQEMDLEDLNIDKQKLELDKQKLQLDVSKAANEAAKKKSEAQPYSTSPSIVDESLGKVNSTTFSESLQQKKVEYGRDMQKYANLLAAEAGRPLPWKENADGTYSPNIGPNTSTQYQNDRAPWQTTEQLLKAANQGYSNGQPSTTAKIAIDALKKKKDNINASEKIMSDINSEFNTKLQQAGVSAEETPYILAAIADGNSDGADDIRKKLQNTYGQNYKSVLGIEDFSASTDEFGNPIYIPGANFQRFAAAKRSINGKLKSLISDRELAFKNAQGQLQSADIQLNYTKEAEELAIIQDFDKVVKLATAGKNATKGDAAKVSSLLERDNNKGNVNTYYTQFDDKTQTGSITVRRGTNDSETISGIPRSDYFTIFPDLVADNTFNNKFKDRLELSNWKTTDVFNSGRMDSYLLDNDKKSDYTVQYHLLEGTSPGTYKLKLWVANKANSNKPLIDGRSFDNESEESTQMNRVSVMGILDWLKNDTNLKLYLNSRGIK